jgi:hypothetical protein
VIGQLIQLMLQCSSHHVLVYLHDDIENRMDSETMASCGASLHHDDTPTSSSRSPLHDRSPTLPIANPHHHQPKAWAPIRRIPYDPKTLHNKQLNACAQNFTIGVRRSAKSAALPHSPLYPKTPSILSNASRMTCVVTENLTLAHPYCPSTPL